VNREHENTCATGARAERRGPCDCGALAARPWRIRRSEDATTDEQRIELEVDGHLTSAEAMDLALTLQALAIEVSHRNIARRERGRRAVHTSATHARKGNP